MLRDMALPPVLPLPMPLQTLLWIRRPTQVMEYAHLLYGKMFRVKLPSFDLALTADRDAIRTIFAAKPDEMHAGRFNRILRSLVGDSSVLLLDGGEHMHRRKLLLPSFHGERMRFYGNTMAEITRTIMATWREGEAFALHKHTQEITLQIILRTVFGADSASLDDLNLRIKRMMSRNDKPMSLVPLLYLANHPERQQQVPWRWLLKQREHTDELLYALIRNARADSSSQDARKDVLAMLLKARDENGEGLDDKDLRDELMTALAAGHETTATSLAWAVERLLANPAAYHNVRDEVRALGPDPDPERLVALPYFDALIKEVLRMRPVLPLVGRVLMKPYTLAGYDLPAGTSVGACIYLAQRNPDVYPEPEAFRPERFLKGSPDPSAWFPFGGGLRRCIGASFALYEMKIVLGTMLAQCDFELAQPSPVRIVRRAITFSPEGGTRVRVRNLDLTRAPPRRAA
jgi:cytochrome P450